MIQLVHLLDDFGMGGVTRALSLFEEPELTCLATSHILPVNQDTVKAPKVEADLIVDHMALSWKRLMFLTHLRARNPKARIVHVEHSYTRSFEQLHVHAKARFRTMLKIASRLVDEIICVSNAQHEWLANTVGLDERKLCVIYPWTDRRELLLIPPLQPQSRRPLRLLAYGRFAPVKNFEALIKAMDNISPDTAQLTVFGNGPQRAALEAQAGDLPHVDVFGPSQSPERHLSRCDAVIIPSLYEAFGLVATEARMAGRPILVADVDGLVEQAGQAGLVASMQDAGEIASAIRRFARLDLVTLGMLGRREVSKQPAGIIAGWTKVLERAAVARKPRERSNPFPGGAPASN